MSRPYLPLPIVLVVAKVGRFASENRIDEDRITDDDRQDDAGADKDNHQAFRRTGSIVDGQVVYYSI